MRKIFSTNKRVSINLACLLFLACFTFSCSNKVAFYVSHKGSDKNPGTIKQPFATIQKAMDAVQELKSNGISKQVTIRLRGGVYFLDKGIRLEENAGGSENLPLIISGYKGEKVSISGGRNIHPDKILPVKDKETLARFSPDVRDKIKQIDLKALGISDYGQMRNVGFLRPYGPVWMELFVDKRPLHLSRWPNDSSIAIGEIIDEGSIPRIDDFSNRGAKFSYDTNRPSKWKTPDDIWISGYFRHGYAEDAVRLAEINTVNRTFTTAQPTLYGFGSDKPWNRWYAYNILEEIDEAGEYYIDRKEGVLYFYPGEECKSVEVSFLKEPLITILGASNAHIKNIIFENSRGMGIYMENTQNNLVKNCVFRNLGIVGVCFGKGIEPFKQLRHQGTGVPASGKIGSFQQHLYENTTFNREGGKNNGVVNCHIYNTGAGGIHLGGGDRLTLAPAGNFVENCSIHDFNRIEKSYRAGIDISGVGNRISHCEIYNTPSMAVLLHGNDHIIEYNNIHDVCLEVDDQGALYYGRDPSERGHFVRYNFFHHIGNGQRTSSVYHDDGACGMTVFGNVFYKGGTIPVLIGGGSDNPYTNNIFIDCPLGISVDNRQQNWAANNLQPGEIFDLRLQAVNFEKPPYSEHYPEFKNYWNENPDLPKRNTVSKNIFYKVKQTFRHNSEWLPFLEDNWITDENPGFVDKAGMNFKLKNKAKAFEKIPGFQSIEFDRIGIQK